MFLRLIAYIFLNVFISVAVVSYALSDILLFAVPSNLHWAFIVTSLIIAIGIMFLGGKKLYEGYHELNDIFDFAPLNFAFFNLLYVGVLTLGFSLLLLGAVPMAQADILGKTAQMEMTVEHLKVRKDAKLFGCRRLLKLQQTKGFVPLCVLSKTEFRNILPGDRLVVTGKVGAMGIRPTSFRMQGDPNEYQL